MQKGKNVQYAIAGVQATPGIEMNVRSHVWVPDSEAGYESDRTPFYAQQTQRRSGRVLTVPCYAGVIFLAAVLIACALLIVGRTSRMKTVSDQINQMEATIVRDRKSVV